MIVRTYFALMEPELGLPLEEAAAILLHFAPAKPSREYQLTYGHEDLPDYESALLAAEKLKIVVKENGYRLDEQYLQRVRPYLSSTRHSGRSALRTLCAARLLALEPQAPSLAALSKIEPVLAALAARIATSGRYVVHGQTGKSVINSATRAIIEVKLSEHFEDFVQTESSSAKTITDPTLLRLRNALLGSEDAARGFATIVGETLGIRLGESQELRWKALLVAATKKPLMSNLALKTSTGLALVDGLATAIIQSAASSATGWASIASAYEALEHPHMSLADFKKALRAAAKEDIVELSPISVSSLMPESVKVRSELEVGGLKFHFVRMSRRMRRM